MNARLLSFSLLCAALLGAACTPRASTGGFVDPDASVTPDAGGVDTQPGDDAMPGADVMPGVDVPPGVDAPADAPSLTCRSDRECSAAGMVCDAAAMRCVECNTAADCGGGMRMCVASRCITVTPCTTSRMCPGQVCNTTLGRCVDCVADTDCPAGQFCRADATCAARACTPSETRCADATHVSICDARGAMATTQACPSGQSCRDNRCQSNACTPGAASCADVSTRRVCNPDGGGFTTSACPATTSCSAGACVPRVCTPGAATCLDARTRSVCNADGLATTTTSCATAAHASGACGAGACALTCDSGYGDCDRAAANGCEAALATDAANCGACGRACPAGNSCAAGACVSCPPPTSPPRVLFYGPLGSVERDAVPAGASVTVATDAMWRSMATSDFAGYNMIVIGDPDSHTDPTSSQYAAAAATASVWGAAVRGRVVITGLDPGFHMTRTDSTPVSPGAGTLLRATFSWISSGAGTGLYVSATVDNGLAFLSPLGGVTSTAASAESVSVVASHPIVVGTTSASLSNWQVSVHDVLSGFPSTFVSLATIASGSVLIARPSQLCER